MTTILNIQCLQWHDCKQDTLKIPFFFFLASFTLNNNYYIHVFFQSPRNPRIIVVSSTTWSSHSQREVDSVIRASIASFGLEYISAIATHSSLVMYSHSPSLASSMKQSFPSDVGSKSYSCQTGSLITPTL